MTIVASLLGGIYWPLALSPPVAEVGAYFAVACFGLIMAQHARALRDQGRRWTVEQVSLAA